MKGYCGHITHLSVVLDFEILIFCLFIYFLVCLYLVWYWFCKRKMVQSFWEKLLFVFSLKQFIFNISKVGVPKNIFDAYTYLRVNSSQKIFEFISQTIFTKLWMLFFIVCKKCLPLWARPLGEGPATKSDEFLEKFLTCLLQSVSCFDFSQYNFWRKKTYPELWFYSVCVNFMLKKPCLKFPKSTS